MCCVRSGLCDGLMTRSEDCQVVSITVCYLDTLTVRWSRPEFGCCATEISNKRGIYKTSNAQNYCNFEHDTVSSGIGLPNTVIYHCTGVGRREYNYWIRGLMEGSYGTTSSMV